MTLPYPILGISIVAVLLIGTSILASIIAIATYRDERRRNKKKAQTSVSLGTKIQLFVLVPMVWVCTTCTIAACIETLLK